MKLTHAAILGAGLGSRLQERSKAKPLAPLLGTTLLAHLIRELGAYPFHGICCALRDELLSEEDKARLPKQENLHYIFVNTESSLHTLGELIRALPASADDSSVFFTMADTVLPSQDLQAFLRFCSELSPGESAILATRHIDDEKPLYVHTENGLVLAFGGNPSPLVTSGMYCLSPKARKIALRCLGEGMHKMRNFLAFLVEQGERVKIFEVEKTIDVDHPSDLDQAEQFLRRGSQ